MGIKTREAKRKHDTFLLENNGQNTEESVFSSISPLGQFLNKKFDIEDKNSSRLVFTNRR